MGINKNRNIMTTDPRAALYRAFEVYPLEPNDPAYVDCEAVRGEQNICKELGDSISLADQSKFTCQLFTGARGCGKSTELRLLKEDLRSQGYFVIYFEADQGDIDIEDTEHTDILLACTRHILEELANKETGDGKQILNWIKERLQSLVDLGLTEIELDKIGVEFSIEKFVKLMASFRQVPNLRQEIRKQIDVHTPTLLVILNEFIDRAMQNLPKYSKRNLVVIVDNLDRIVPVTRENKRTNHEEIFLDRKNQMQGLNCHVIYTVPISMVYAKYGANMTEEYQQTIIMPMITVKTKDNQVYGEGIDKLKEIIQKRVEKAKVSLGRLFESAEALDEICQKSGGYVRNLMQLMQSAVKNSTQMPISDRAVQRAISELREVYRKTLYGDDWQKLAEVWQTKSVSKDSKSGEYRDLLFRRCVLEYRTIDVKGKTVFTHDVHPLIEGMEEFIAEISKNDSITKTI